MLWVGGHQMKYFTFLVLATSCGSCSLAGLPPRAPDSLVGESSVALAATEYLIATRVLAETLGYQLDGSEVPRGEFTYSMNIGGRLDSRLLQGKSRELQISNIRAIPTARTEEDQRVALARFLVTGQQAASMLCRSYVRGLADRDAGIEMLKSEFGAISTFTNAAFKIFKATTKTGQFYNTVSNFALSTITNYEELAFLKPEMTSTLDLVVATQVELSTHYAKKENIPVVTLSGALNAMHNIEYQCSVVGMRALIDNATKQSAKSVTIGKGGIIVVGEKK